MKKCFICKTRKALDEFYKHPQMADGHLGKCKKCAKRHVRANYRKRRQYYSEYDRTTRKTKERSIKKMEYQRKHRILYPRKYRARQKLGVAVRSGRIIKLPCQICGDIKSQAHHVDYRKPLEVEWFCFKHHREIAHGQTVVV